jgi:antirestriction protein ArdC
MIKKQYKPRSGKDIAREITAMVIDLLKKGEVPWEKPWSGVKGDLSTNHHNAFSKHVYRGLNPLILELTAHKGGWSERRWTTFGAARKAGGNVKAGEKGTMVTFWKFETRRRDIEDPDTGDVTQRMIKVPMLRSYTVFNVEQCEGLKLKPLEPAPVREPIEEAQKIVDAYRDMDDAPRFNVNGVDRACYSPVWDALQVPSEDRFKRQEDFYSTLFHEMGHSTGTKGRLNRVGVTDRSTFGDHQYSREELVAEFCAAILSGHAGIVAKTIDNSAAYLGHWVKKLEDDPYALVVGAGQGDKAAGFILAAGEAQEAQEAQERELVAA